MVNHLASGNLHATNTIAAATIKPMGCAVKKPAPYGPNGFTLSGPNSSSRARSRAERVSCLSIRSMAIYSLHLLPTTRVRLPGPLLNALSVSAVIGLCSSLYVLLRLELNNHPHILSAGAAVSEPQLSPWRRLCAALILLRTGLPPRRPPSSRAARSFGRLPSSQNFVAVQTSKRCLTYCPDVTATPSRRNFKCNLSIWSW